MFILNDSIKAYTNFHFHQPPPEDSYYFSEGYSFSSESRNQCYFPYYSSISLENCVIPSTNIEVTSGVHENCTNCEFSNTAFRQPKVSHEIESEYFWGLVRTGLIHLYRRYLVPIGVSVSAHYLNRKIDNYIQYSADRYEYDSDARQNVHHIADTWANDMDYNSAYYHVSNCPICQNTAAYLAR